MAKAILNATFSLADIKENGLFPEFGKMPAWRKLNLYLQKLATPHGVKVSVRNGIREMGSDQENPTPYEVTYTNRQSLVNFLVDLEKDANGYTSVSETDIEDFLAEAGI